MSIYCKLDKCPNSDVKLCLFLQNWFKAGFEWLSLEEPKAINFQQKWPRKYFIFSAIFFTALT